MFLFKQYFIRDLLEQRLKSTFSLGGGAWGKTCISITYVGLI